jgi:ATP synthase protein I
MSFARLVMRRVIRRLFTIQFIITLVVAFTYLTFHNTNGFLSALYGGLITLTGTLLMAWRITRAGDTEPDDKQQGYIEIYAGVIQKFMLTLVLMAFGMGFLKLNPLAMLIGFSLTQLSFIANKVDTSPIVKA